MRSVSHFLFALAFVIIFTTPVAAQVCSAISLPAACRAAHNNARFATTGARCRCHWLDRNNTAVSVSPTLQTTQSISSASPTSTTVSMEQTTTSLPQPPPSTIASSLLLPSTKQSTLPVSSTTSSAAPSPPLTSPPLPTTTALRACEVDFSYQFPWQCADKACTVGTTCMPSGNGQCACAAEPLSVQRIRLCTEINDQFECVAQSSLACASGDKLKRKKRDSSDPMCEWTADVGCHCPIENSVCSTYSDESSCTEERGFCYGRTMPCVWLRDNRCVCQPPPLPSSRPTPPSAIRCSMTNDEEECVSTSCGAGQCVWSDALERCRCPSDLRLSDCSESGTSYFAVICPVNRTFCNR